MSTRANIIIQENENDQAKEFLYHHWDGYPSGVGRTLAGILNTIPKNQLSGMSKRELAQWIANEDRSFEITTPREAPDADYAYTVSLSERQAFWKDLRMENRGDWLCDF